MFRANLGVTDPKKVQDLIRLGKVELKKLKVSPTSWIIQSFHDWNGRRGRLSASTTSFVTEQMLIRPFNPQRQTAVSKFFQLDRLVVEGQKTVSLLFLILAAT